MMNLQVSMLLQALDHLSPLFDSMETVTVILDSTDANGNLLQYKGSFFWDEEKDEWLFKLEVILE